MQSVNVTIDVKAQDIPRLVCTNSGEQSPFMTYITGMAEAVAHNLGVEEFLNRPEREDELRRALWQKLPGL